MPYGIMPDSARQEGSATTYGLINKLNGIPGVLIHGRYDVGGPLVTAWQLSQRWTTSRLRVLDDAGHGGGKEFMPRVLGALNEFAAL
jgi:proline iminopeptidase